MGQGLKNLTQTSRSAEKKQNDGTYHEEDSGVGISDLEEESSPADMLPSVSESHAAAARAEHPVDDTSGTPDISATSFAISSSAASYASFADASPPPSMSHRWLWL
jgi:hypothetical protein